MDLIKKELKIMYLLDHEYIVKLYSHFEEADSVYLIMELTQGVIISGYCLILKGRSLCEANEVKEI